MSNAKPAYGTLLKRGDGGSPEVFSTVGEVRTIKGPSMEVSEEEVTSHSSAQQGAFREFVATLIDAGTVECELSYNPSDTTHQGIRSDLVERRTANWKIVLAGNLETISFAAFVKQAPYEFPTDGVMKQSLTLRVSGAPTWS